MLCRRLVETADLSAEAKETKGLLLGDCICSASLVRGRRPALALVGHWDSTGE